MKIFSLLGETDLCILHVGGHRRDRPRGADLGPLTPEARRWSRRNASAIDAFPAAVAQPRGPGKRRFRHKVAARFIFRMLPEVHLQRVDLHALHASVNSRFLYIDFYISIFNQASRVFFSFFFF